MELTKTSPAVKGYFLDVLWNQIVVVFPCFYLGIRVINDVTIAKI